MNNTNLLMLVVGTIFGVVIGYVTFSPKPEFLIEAEGFRGISFKDDKVSLEIVKRVDADTVDVFKTIQMPIQGFIKGHGASKDLINTLVDKGVLAPTSDAADTSESTTDE